MINIVLKVNDEEVETVRWMKEVWKEDWLVKPNNMEVQMGKLCDTEKEYLNKVMQWVYHDGLGVVTINGKQYDVNEYVTLTVVSSHLEGRIETLCREYPTIVLEVTGDVTVLPQVTCQRQQA